LPDPFVVGAHESVVCSNCARLSVVMPAKAGIRSSPCLGAGGDWIIRLRGR
jgi:hypothetical protein